MTGVGFEIHGYGVCRVDVNNCCMLKSSIYSQACGVLEQKFIDLISLEIYSSFASLKRLLTTHDSMLSACFCVLELEEWPANADYRPFYWARPIKHFKFSFEVSNFNFGVYFLSVLFMLIGLRVLIYIDRNNA